MESKLFKKVIAGAATLAMAAQFCFVIPASAATDLPYTQDYENATLSDTTNTTGWTADAGGKVTLETDRTKYIKLDQGGGSGGRGFNSKFDIDLSDKNEYVVEFDMSFDPSSSYDGNQFAVVTGSFPATNYTIAAKECLFHMDVAKGSDQAVLGGVSSSKMKYPKGKWCHYVIYAKPNLNLATLTVTNLEANNEVTADKVVIATSTNVKQIKGLRAVAGRGGGIILFDNLTVREATDADEFGEIPEEVLNNVEFVSQINKKIAQPDEEQAEHIPVEIKAVGSLNNDLTEAPDTTIEWSITGLDNEDGYISLTKEPGDDSLSGTEGDKPDNKSKKVYFNVRNGVSNWFGTVNVKVTYKDGDPITISTPFAVIGASGGNNLAPEPGYFENMNSYDDSLVGYVGTSTGEKTQDMVLNNWSIYGSNGSRSFSLKKDDDGTKYLRFDDNNGGGSTVGVYQLPNQEDQYIVDMTVRIPAGKMNIGHYAKTSNNGDSNSSWSVSYDGGSLKVGGQSIPGLSDKDSWYRIVISADESAGTFWARAYKDDVLLGATEPEPLNMSNAKKMNNGSAEDIDPPVMSYKMEQNYICLNGYPVDLNSFKIYKPTVGEMKINTSEETVSVPIEPEKQETPETPDTPDTSETATLAATTTDVTSSPFVYDKQEKTLYINIKNDNENENNGADAAADEGDNPNENDTAGEGDEDEGGDTSDNPLYDLVRVVYNEEGNIEKLSTIENIEFVNGSAKVENFVLASNETLMLFDNYVFQYESQSNEFYYLTDSDVRFVRITPADNGAENYAITEAECVGGYAMLPNYEPAANESLMIWKGNSSFVYDYHDSYSNGNEEWYAKNDLYVLDNEAADGTAKKLVKTVYGDDGSVEAVDAFDITFTDGVAKLENIKIFNDKVEDDTPETPAETAADDNESGTGSETSKAAVKLAVIDSDQAFVYIDGTLYINAELPADAKLITATYTEDGKLSGLNIYDPKSYDKIAAADGITIPEGAKVMVWDSLKENINPLTPAVKAEDISEAEQTDSSELEDTVSWVRDSADKFLIPMLIGKTPAADIDEFYDPSRPVVVELSVNITSTDGFPMSSEVTWSLVDIEDESIILEPDRQSAKLTIKAGAPAGPVTITATCGAAMAEESITLTTTGNSIAFGQSTSSMTIPFEGEKADVKKFEAYTVNREGQKTEFAVDDDGNPTATPAKITYSILNKNMEQIDEMPAGITFTVDENGVGTLTVTDDAKPQVLYVKATNNDQTPLTRSVKVNIHGLSFAFGTNAPADDNDTQVTNETYTDKQGYGFADSSTVTAEASDVKGVADYRFKIKVPNGNYSVKVTSSCTNILSEVVESVPAVTGISKSGSSFSVAVCDGVLDLTFTKDSTLTSLSVTQAPTKNKLDKPMVYAIGDSTTNNTGNGAKSWGNCVGTGVTLPDVFSGFANHGMAGRDSVNFYNQGRVADVLLAVAPGDYVTVNMGINSKEAGEPASYMTLLRDYYVEGIIQRGAIPVIVTATPLGFSDKATPYDAATGKFTSSRGDGAHNNDLRAIAQEKNLNIIELGQWGEDYFNSLTMDDVTAYNTEYGTNYTSVLDLVKSWYGDHNHYYEYLGNKIGDYILGCLAEIATKSPAATE